MSTATIKLFLANGDPKRLRTGEISNWSGKAVAAPRTDLDELLAREELQKPGVYILIGTDPNEGSPACYIGEAEVIRDRLKQHRAKDFWIHVIVFVSKDENLTKSHIRYLEGRLIVGAQEADRFQVVNSQTSGSKLPESDREEMEVFLGKIRQLLPVLGSDILTPRPQATDVVAGPANHLVCEIKGLKANGRRTEDGFVVFAGSQAVKELRPSAPVRHSFVVKLRNDLSIDGTLAGQGDYLVFTRDAEFSSPSAAAAVVSGGGANGLTMWRTNDGITLKKLEGKADS
jgi:hypothetical protein